MKAVICDQGPNNQKCMSKFANISIEKPFFTIDTYKIYVIFEYGNNLKKQYFIFNDIISWKYINDFYDFDFKNEVKV